MEKEKLDSLLEGTEILDKIKQIEAIYNEINIKQDVFCNKLNIHCKSNCGKCCENFTPDILEVEALYVAYGLIINDMVDSVLEKIENYNNDKFCPLYDYEKFCTIYNFRPLICRMFNAGVVKNKEGNPIFRKCKWNDTGIDVSTNILLENKDDLIIMSDYGMRIEELDATYKNKEMLYEAIKKAIYKIELILSYKM